MQCVDKWEQAIHRFQKKPEVACKRGSIALRLSTNMADEISKELRKSWNVCKFKATCPEQMLKKGKNVGHEYCATQNCNNRSDNRPDLSFHEFPSDKQGRKTWGIRMKRGDAYFATVANKFCCSEYFLSTDFQPSLTGHRRSLKPGAVPSVFPEKTDVH